MKPIDVSSGKKVCTVCGLEKPLSEFRLVWKVRLDGVRPPRPACKVCERKAGLEYYYKDHEKIRKANRERRRRRNRWRITLQQSRGAAKKGGHIRCLATESEIEEAFTGFCAICGVEEGEKRLSMDHDHSTGKFRFWLCGNCNHGIGYFKDSPKLLRLAAAMLEELKEK